MNPEITSFCWRAVKRGILSRGQCLVLREMFKEGAKIEDCVNFILSVGLVDKVKAEALKLQMKSMPKPGAGTPGEPLKEVESDVPAEVAAKDKKWEPDPGLEWFCYLAIEEDILTKEICLCLIADIQETTDMLSLAQAVFETGFCNDLHTVQRLTDEALEQWAQGNPVPYSIFRDD